MFAVPPAVFGPRLLSLLYTSRPPCGFLHLPFVAPGLPLACHSRFTALSLMSLACAVQVLFSPAIFLGAVVGCPPFWRLEAFPSCPQRWPLCIRLTTSLPVRLVQAGEPALQIELSFQTTPFRPSPLRLLTGEAPFSFRKRLVVNVFHCVHRLSCWRRGSLSTSMLTLSSACLFAGMGHRFHRIQYRTSLALFGACFSLPLASLPFLTPSTL